MSGKSVFSGVLARETVNRGSKSEHVATVLKTADGGGIALRLAGDNPFSGGAAFAPFIGRAVSVSGIRVGGTLIVADIGDLKVAPKRTPPKFQP